MAALKSEKTTQISYPKEFDKIIRDLVGDIQTTFPEYNGLIAKWWKEESFFSYMEDDVERQAALLVAQDRSVQFIFQFSLKKLPPRFFDILYQNTDIFKEDSAIDTEFLPHIHFKNLWQEVDTSEKTKETLWKYLQLMLFSVTPFAKDFDADAMTSMDFKGKLEEVIGEIQNVFYKGTDNKGTDNKGSESDDADAPPLEKPTAESSSSTTLPNAEDLYSHVTGMMNGKLGQLAKEIAEEAADDFNMDMENVSSAQDVFQNLMKNPTKMMNLVKSVGSKLDGKIKTGEIKESELIAEATEMMQKMKDMPGLGNIQDLLSKMGMGTPNGGKIDLNAMEAQLNRNKKAAETRERMRSNVEKKKASANVQEAQMKALQQSIQQNSLANQPLPTPLTDEELIAMMGSTEKGKPSTTSGQKKKGKAKK